MVTGRLVLNRKNPSDEVLSVILWSCSSIFPGRGPGFLQDLTFKTFQTPRVLSASAYPAPC